MSNKKLDALKALFKKENENKNNDGNNKKRGDMYPFWQMKVNEKAVVRLLPDKNLENPYMFYVDKLEHTLSINGKDKRIPCLQMYGEKCPICDLSRDFYKAEGKGSVNGKYYYRKKTSLARVLVLEDPLPADEETGETAVGKVLNTQLGYQLMEKIKAEVLSDDMDTLPWDFEDGYNFTIAKTPQGEYGTYAVASGFARRPSAIPAELADEIELIDLETLLPANPGYDYVKRKLEAHQTGDDDGDDDSDGDNDDDGDKEETPAPQKKPAPKKSVPVKEEAPDDSDDSDDSDDDADDDGEDILAQIRRNRKNK